MSYYYLDNYEKCTSSQEPVEVCLADSFSGIRQYVQLRLKSIQERSCCKDKKMDSSHGSLSGMISTPLTGNHGEGLSTSLLEDSPAKISAQQEREQESQGNAQGSGSKWREWFAKYDPDSCSWKTPQCSLLGDLEPYSETWPKWGTMRNGVCSEQTMPEHLIEERESGYWPTPTLAPDAPNTNSNRKCGPNSLTECAKLGSPLYQKRMIPTPTCSDAFTSNLKSTQQKPHTMHSVSLAQLCEKMPEKMWPTPRSRDWKDSMGTVPPSRVLNPGQATLGQQVAIGMKESYPTPCVTGMGSGSGNCEKANKLFENGQINDDERRSKRSGNGGQLNPDWVEWLMGWPIGWTRMEPIELDRRDWVVDPADDGEVPRVGTDIANRAKRLKAIGNGQVPQVATTMFNELVRRINDNLILP